MDKFTTNHQRNHLFEKYGKFDVLTRIPSSYVLKTLLFYDKEPNPLLFLKQSNMEITCYLEPELEPWKGLFLTNNYESYIKKRVFTLLMKAFPQVQGLIICRTMTILESKVFSVKKWRILIFVNCQLGNFAAKKLENMSCQNLQVLNINSDHISNYGFKRLIKWVPPHLSNFTLQNTNITSDAVKLFRKQMRPAYTNIFINGYKLIFDVFKQMTHLRVRSITQQSGIFSLKGRAIRRRIDYAPVAYFSKVEYREDLTISISYEPVSQPRAYFVKYNLVTQIFLDNVKDFIIFN